MKNELTSVTEYGTSAHRVEEAFACHAVEGNPATEEHEEMFAMFERENWSDEKCRAYLAEWTREKTVPTLAAE
ncbi:MAG: hypothetical protein JKY31_13290 [Rhodobacteraceae bacterium]|nr:hypothetical protein [Paracoccaceae bacterium]